MCDWNDSGACFNNVHILIGSRKFVMNMWGNKRMLPCMRYDINECLPHMHPDIQQ